MPMRDAFEKTRTFSLPDIYGTSMYVERFLFFRAIRALCTPKVQCRFAN